MLGHEIDEAFGEMNNEGRSRLSLLHQYVNYN